MDHKAVIGIDLGATNIRGGLVNGKEITGIHAMPVRSKGAVEEVLEDIFSIADPLMNGEVNGIGIGVPSVVDVEKGIVYDVQNIPSWKEVPLKAIMEERYKVPVFVNNDANCFAYPKSLTRLRIALSELKNSGILGAAGLYYDAL